MQHMMQQGRQTRSGLVVAAIAALAMAGMVSAPAQADFYRGKSIDFVVGANPGGGYDTYARAIARHMPRFIPGSPGIVVRNMPGAGSGRAAAFMYTAAPRDGTTMASVFPGAVQGPLVDASLLERWDPTRFIYLASADSGTRTCATFHTSPTKTFADAQNRKTIMGASAAGGSTRDYILLLNALAGTQFEMVAGYTGTVDIFLAMERGEVEGLCGIDWSSFRTQRAQWLEQNQTHLLAQFGTREEPAMTEMGVPEGWTFLKDDEGRQIMEAVLAQQAFSRPYIAPPGTPTEAVQILRAAFSAVLRDDALLADAEKVNIDINPTDGIEVQNLVERMFATPQPIVEKMQAILAGN